MKTLTTGMVALAMTAGTASAGGIDRSGQFLSPLFQDGGETGAYMQLSFGTISPTANGTNVAIPGGVIGDPLASFDSASFAYKNTINDKLSFALIVDQPFGASVDYGPTPLAGPLAGLGLQSQADITSNALTGVLRYKFNENFSVHGGLRNQQLKGTIVSGQGILIGDGERDWGYLAGVAYERKDIAMRVALTYNSEIDNNLKGTTFNPVGMAYVPVPDFTVTTPESWNLEFQTGIAKDTLLFGSVRYVKWDGFNLTAFGADGPATEYVNFGEDTVTYSIGVGRRLNENWSIAATYGYEAAGDRPDTTLLAPTTGSETFGLAATYTEGPMTLTAGVTMGRLGDQTITPGPAALGGTAVDFNDNEVFGAGIRLGYNF